MLVVACIAVISGCVQLTAAGKHAVPTFSGKIDMQTGLIADVDHPSFREPLKFDFAGRSDISNGHGQLKVNQTTIADGDDVLVSWTGIKNVNVHDWIGIYSPAGSEESDYLDFMYVNVSSTWQSGSGSFPIKLFNMRTDYQFRYYQVLSTKHYVAALSPRVSVIEHEPCHGHLSFGNELGSMVLMWTTDSPEDLMVEYSRDELFTVSTTLPNSSISARTYTAKDMCGPPASNISAVLFRDPGYQVTAVFQGLRLATKYYYRYGTKGSRLQTARFTTQSHPGTDHMRVLTFGDMGVHYHPFFWHQPGAPMIGDLLVDEVMNNEVDAILHYGDLSYGVGHGYIWDQWGWLMSKSARYTPYMVGVGNHEYDHIQVAPGGIDVSGVNGTGYHPKYGIGGDSLGECGVPPFFRHKMPSEHNDGNSIFWYSFDVHNVRFIFISSEHDMSPGTIQYNWLEKVLASTDREVFPWLVLTLHRPMYSNESDSVSDNHFANMLREEFEDLVMKYKVNLMLSAHYHSYQRSCPVYKNKCMPDGTAPVHIVIGTAGANLQSATSTFPAPWTVAGYVDFGYSVLESNSTNLHLDWISQSLGKKDKRVVDSVDIPLWRA